MKNLRKIFFCLLFLLSPVVLFAQNHAPVVTNVDLLQRTDGSMIVDIYYDVSDADSNQMNVSITASSDSGATWNLTCASVSGAIGSGVTSGTGKHIIWNFGQEHTNFFSNKVMVEISADDRIAGSCPGLPTVTYEGKTYNTVQIGTQCWLKENLDVGTMIDSLQNQTNNSIIEKYCYNNNPANCATYGGLYQWNEAMQSVTTQGAQGICPTGWHIPTKAELQALGAAVNNDGNALKAVGQGTGSGAGTNTSGFSALLAGYRHYNATFYDLSYRTYFWSSSEYDATTANFMYLNLHYGFVSTGSFNKEFGFIVRCAKGLGNTLQPPTLSAPAYNASNIAIPPTLKWIASSGATSYTLQVSTSNFFQTTVYNDSTITDTIKQVVNLTNNTRYYWRVITKNANGSSAWSSVWTFVTAASSSAVPCPGIPTVTYSGKTYNTVQIGTQCWLKENLDVGVMINSASAADSMRNNGIIEKYCYNNNPNNCATYGGLYQWNEAMQYVTTPGTKGICPTGWHIPTSAEYQALSTAVGGNSNALKAVGQGTGGGAGTNTSGFSALLAGDLTFYGIFYNLSYTTTIWSSTEHGAFFADYMNLNDYNRSIFFYDEVKESGFSVRCAKD